MSQDPFQKHEAEKYANLIPGRELILEHPTKQEKPAGRDELVIELNIEGEEQIEALRRRPRTMECDGQLVFTRHQCYVLSEYLDLLKGTVIGHRDGYGFLRVKECKDDLRLSSEQMKIRVHGDQVLAQPPGTDHRGRREARIVRVLASKTSQTVSRYFTDAGVGLAVLDDSRLSFDILIPLGDIMDAWMDYMVAVELTQRLVRRTETVRKIVEVLGDSMGTGMIVGVTLRIHGTPYVWPPVTEEQAPGLREQIPEEAKTGRIDLCSLPLAITDGEDVRGFDDAVYCEEKRGGGWRLWVAIVDVSYYVRSDMPLNGEVCSRGTSAYFPSQVVLIPPEVLSSGLCSLNPQVDRPCMVCKMTISLKGRLTGFKFYGAVMSSYACPAYTEV